MNESVLSYYDGLEQQCFITFTYVIADSEAF